MWLRKLSSKSSSSISDLDRFTKSSEEPEEIQSANEELKTTNEELRTRNLEARQVNNDLVNLLTNVNIPILMLASDLTIRRFTPIAQRLFNLIPGDVGRPLTDIRANLDAPDLEAWIVAVMDMLNAQEHEVQDREGHWHLLRIRPYRTIDNQIDGAVLTLMDIDALKQSAAQIEAARNYAESIVETVRHPLLVLDANLRVNTVNQAFYQTFQVTPTQTEQQLIFELGNGQWNIPQLRSLLEELLPRNSQIQDFVVEHDFEQIGTKVMLLNAREVLPAPNGRMILLAMEDITQQQQAAAEHTQLLLSEQAARAEAEAATASKDEFISILSHELRSPLNAIQGWAKLLGQGTLDPATTTRALETIERNVKMQSQLIEDLLDITRIVEGNLRLELSPLDLTPVIQAAIDTVQLIADDKQIQLEALLAPCPGRISADASRMQQVIWNLLTNAIKFTPTGGRVEIRLACSPSQAEVQITDTGKGISPDFLPDVFERFRQAEGTRTASRSGLGLGLTIVRALVELHGGTIAADSPGIGQGATFIVRLPLVERGEGERGRGGGGEILIPHPSSLIPPLASLGVLVVDDIADTRDLVAFLLEQAGASVTVAASATEALTVLSQSQPDVLVSDIAMPDVDGYTLMQQIRALPPEQGGQILAIALTTFVAETDIQQAIAVGFQRHLPKPVEPDRLIAAIVDLIGSRSR